jgi:hypothetical protein
VLNTLFENDAPQNGFGSVETSLLTLSSRLAAIAKRLELCSLRRTAFDLRAISESLVSVAAAVNISRTGPPSVRTSRVTSRDQENEAIERLSVR